MSIFGDSRRAHISIELLSTYLDRQETAQERARVEEHLRACAACQQELESLRQAVTVLRALPRVPVPRAFTLAEAQVGRAARGARPAWSGGWLRGLGAVTAVIVVAVLATALLRQPAWAPGETIARVAPAQAPAEQAISPASSVAEAPAPEVVSEKAVEVEAAPTEAPAAEVVTLAEPLAEEAPAPVEPVSQPAPPSAGDAEPSGEAARSAKEAVPMTSSVESADAMAMAAPGLGAAPGIGGGGGVAGEVALAEAATPEPVPPLAPLGEVLPATAGVAYVDQQGLWAIDGESGLRELARIAGATAPLISPGRRWVAFRVYGAEGLEVWAAGWDTAGARKLLSESDLPKDSLEAPYSQRLFHDLRWIPEREQLAVTMIVVSDDPSVAPRFELWDLDPATGELRFVLNMPESRAPAYSPDGSRFALLAYGTETGPEGSLSVFDADGADPQMLLEFPGGTNRASYPSQIRWLPGAEGLWAAIPNSAAEAGTTLYRAGTDGRSGSEGSVDATEVFWSPDGRRLAYVTAPVAGPGQAAVRELYLARADGSGAELYASLQDGAFAGWSPDGEQFLFADDFAFYAGAPGKPPLRMASLSSIVDPRWIAPGQIVHLQPQGNDWMLVSRSLEGETASLLALPLEASYDVAYR